jgi:homoserine O-acetyltransferase
VVQAIQTETKAVKMKNQTSLAVAGEPSPDPCCCVDERVLTLSGPQTLASGQSLSQVKIAMRVAGPRQAPVVIAIGGISASRRAVSLDGETEDGWWQGVLGADGVDITQAFRVLGVDYLGGNGETSGPANWGGKGEDFPEVHAADQADLLAAVLDQLGIDQVAAVIGASYGGMVALQFAARFPQRVQKVMVIAAAHRPEPMATARRFVQKQLLELAETPEARLKALAVARSLAMTTYRSNEEFRKRFGGPSGRASLESYLEYTGEQFAKRFDFHAYQCLLESIDTHTLNPARLVTPLTLAGFDTDELCPPRLLQELASMAPGTELLTEIKTGFGHDAFLLEIAQVSAAVTAFLQGDQA